MSFEIITKAVYRCKCEATLRDDTICGYEWDADTLPERCASCKRRTWNGRKKRQCKDNPSPQGLLIDEAALQYLGYSTHLGK